MKHVTLVGKTGNVEVRKILVGMLGVKEAASRTQAYIDGT
jgi:hypothetical protein